MSGIYIPGLEIPTSGHITVIEINCLGGVRMNGKPIENKVILVPDHGRLIEAVMLRHKCYQQYEDFMKGKIDGKTALLNIEKEIIDAPTIIPPKEE